MAKYRTGHLFKRGSNFYVRWTVEGKVFSRALRDPHGNPITTRREADEARAKVMAPFMVADEASALESIAAKIEGRKTELARLEDQQNPPLPIKDAWREFIASPSRPDTGSQTLVIYEYQFAKWVAWMTEKHPNVTSMRGVTREITEEYATTLNHGTLTGNTYNKHLNVLAMVFRVLKQKAKLAENAWEEIPRKRVVPQSRRELTVDELKKVCQTATGELRLLLVLGIYTGLRQGDACTLRWCEVDLQRGLITRIPNKTARRNPKPVLIPIHPVLREMLEAIPAQQRGEYVLPNTTDNYYRHRWGLVQRIQDHFGACGIRVHKAGTDGNGKRPVVEVGFHSLRHTFVSLCREGNAPLAVVESIVGHSNPAMTRHYTHVGELAAGQAVAALPAVIGEAKPLSSKREPALLREIKAVVQSIAAKDWREKKAALLAMLAEVL
jgi:integrase